MSKPKNLCTFRWKYRDPSCNRHCKLTFTTCLVPNAVAPPVSSLATTYGLVQFVHIHTDSYIGRGQVHSHASVALARSGWWSQTRTWWWSPSRRVGRYSRAIPRDCVFLNLECDRNWLLLEQHLSYQTMTIMPNMDLFERKNDERHVDSRQSDLKHIQNSNETVVPIQPLVSICYAPDNNNRH